MNDTEEDLFLMANLRPDDTGLPMVIWVSERGHAQHDVRIKVSTRHGAQVSATIPMAIFGVRPHASLLHGYVSPSDQGVVEQWIDLNRAVIVDYWNSAISTRQMLQRIQPLSPPVPP